MMKVSVIIPTYNRAGFLKSAIESVLKQTYKAFEIVIVDDGSTDDTREIVESYASMRITYIFLNRAGPGKARNEGIKRAQGNVIAFLDSDDRWACDKLALQMEMLSRDPGVKLVCSDFQCIDAQGKVLRGGGVIEKGDQHTGQFLRDFLEGKLPVATSTVIVRREAFDQAGLFDEEHMIAEDFDLWIKLSAKGGVACVPQPLTFVRIHPNNISCASNTKTWLAAVTMIKKNRKNIKTSGLSPEKYIARFYMIAAHSAFTEMGRLRALRLFLKAIGYSPYDYRGYKGVLKCFLPNNILMRLKKATK